MVIGNLMAIGLSCAGQLACHSDEGILHLSNEIREEWGQRVR